MIAFLIRYRKVLAIALVVTLLVAWIGNSINSAIEDAERRGYDRATAEHAAQVAAANAEQAKRDAAARAAFQAKESNWIGERSALQNEIDELASRPPVVRLCPPAADHREVPGAVAAAGSAGRAGEQGVDSVPVSRDIGPELTRLFGECESYRRRLIELKGRWPE